MRKKKMNRITIILNNVQTDLLIWGDPFSVNTKEVVVCITGNPGVPDFYIDFASELYKNVKLPICVVGHAGHGVVTNNKLNIFGTQDKHLFDLQAQAKHKLDLLENKLPKNSKIHLIGHSIGAWIILELLQNNDQLRQRVASINLLFPTIQRMAESKNGRFLNNVVRQIHWFLLFLSLFLYLIPSLAFRYLIYLYLVVKGLPYTFCDAILKFLNPYVIKNVLTMAFDEMDIVQKLNQDSLHKIKHLTNVIYGSHDSWAPLEYMEDLKMFKPHIQMKEAHNIDHAFVLKSSERVANMVESFMKLSFNT